jgi:hypothetical protein
VFQLKEKQIREHFPDAVIAYWKAQGGPIPAAKPIRRLAQAGNLPLLVNILIRADRKFVEGIILDNAEMSILYDMLSTKARQLLNDRSADERSDLILTWVESANQSTRGVSMEMLKRFEDTLSVNERDRLSKMSSDDYLKTLRQMYIKSRKSTRPRQGWEEDLEENFQEFFNLDFQ